MLTRATAPLPEKVDTKLWMSQQVAENNMFVAAGPVSRIRRAALKTDNLFEISRREVSTMSTLSVLAGLRHTGVTVSCLRIVGC
jgi:hypothetical protein